MVMLVLMTGAAGLLTSVALLHLHLDLMAVRYVVSVAFAYGAFLGLIRLWIAGRQRRWRRTARGPGIRPIHSVEAYNAQEERDTSKLDWLELLDLFGDDMANLILLAAGLVSIVFVVWYVISLIAFAPEFLAEVLLDGVFAAALYHRLRRIEHRHWFRSVFARTRAAFLWTLLFFAFIGGVSQHYAPEAISIGGVVRHETERLR